MALAELKRLDAQRQNMSGHLRILRSKIPGFQARVAEDVENGFFEFYQRLVALLSELVGARRKGNGVAMNECMALIREIIAAFQTELIKSSPSIAGSSSANPSKGSSLHTCI